MFDKAKFNLLGCPDCGSTLNEKENKTFCASCGKKYDIKNGRIFFIEPPSDAPESLQDIEPTNQKKWTNWRKSNYVFFKEHLSNLPSDKILIDLGAGPSQFRDITRRFDNAVSVDFYPYELIDIVADLTQKLPFKDSSADIVLFSNVLEHIPNPQFFLSECRRILKNGGVLIGTIPFLMRIHNKPYDYNRFTNYMLEKLLKEAEFTDVEIKSLATPFDVYEKMQLHFFYHLLGSKFSENIIAHILLKFIARLIWRLNKLQTLIFKPLYNKAEISNDFTQGYGFIGYKL